MGVADRVSPDPALPEQQLLRDGDRLQDVAGAFLRGEITAAQYSEMTLAEISRRAPLDPLIPWGEPEPEPPTVEMSLVADVPVEAVRENSPIVPGRVEIAPPRRDLADDDRSIVLARAFVGGRIRANDFLRLIRDV